MLIRVGITKPKDRPTYQLVWIDPKTRKQRRRSSGERRKREAEDRARELERELNAGLGARAWPDFRAKYEAEHLSSLAARTVREWRSIEARLVKELDPVWVRDLDEAALATYARRLRDAGASEDTIAKHLRTIGAALRRAAAWKIIPVAPTIAMPRRAKGRRKMKGRPLSAEEFERMLKATPTSSASSGPRAGGDYFAACGSPASAFPRRSSSGGTTPAASACGISLPADRRWSFTPS